MSALWLALLAPVVVAGVWALQAALVGYRPRHRWKPGRAVVTPQEAQERVRAAAYVARQAAQRLAVERAQAARLDALLAARELTAR